LGSAPASNPGVTSDANIKIQEYQDKMKTIFDRRAKEINFVPGDILLRWDSKREEPGKHGKLIAYGLDHIKL
jgi:hypothetical protein